MRHSISATVATWALPALIMAWPHVGAAAATVAPESCARLAALGIAGTKITAAQHIPAGKYVRPPSEPAAARMDDRVIPRTDWSDVPAFCRVSATVQTSPTTSIEVEVWLPSDTWNGNFLVHAYRYYGGLIEPEILVDALLDGYATVTTDNGSGRTQGAAFMFNNPEKVTDWAHRAWHEATAKAKDLMKAYYGTGPGTSYFDSCGGASRFAMKSMQMYPEDYDFYAIGGHSEHTTNLTFGQWAGWQLAQDPEGTVEKKLGLLHSAAVQACDAKDGVKDGIINAPDRCGFDPGSLQCAGAETAACLTTKQVDTARKLYAPVLNPRTGQEIQGPRYPGSELGWADRLGQEPRPFAVDFARYFLFRDPSWDYRQATINFDSHVALANASTAASGNAIDPNIGKFFARGGRLLMHQGWNDGNFVKTPINYYSAVLKEVGPSAGESMRLFMVPGTGHCVDGRSEFTTSSGYWNKTRVIDTLGALRRWEQSGKAPDSLLMHVTERSNHQDVLLCPYPKAAHYKGQGDVSDAANFECRNP